MFELLYEIDTFEFEYQPTNFIAFHRTNRFRFSIFLFRLFPILCSVFIIACVNFYIYILFGRNDTQAYQNITQTVVQYETRCFTHRNQMLPYNIHVICLA